MAKYYETINHEQIPLSVLSNEELEEVYGVMKAVLATKTEIKSADKNTTFEAYCKLVDLYIKPIYNGRLISDSPASIQNWPKNKVICDLVDRLWYESGYRLTDNSEEIDSEDTSLNKKYYQ